jgi:hypothetical protein
MAKQNYAFEKRQRENAKKKKKEEKRKQKEGISTENNEQIDSQDTKSTEDTPIQD